MDWKIDFGLPLIFTRSPFLRYIGNDMDHEDKCAENEVDTSVPKKNLRSQITEYKARAVIWESWRGNGMCYNNCSMETGVVQQELTVVGVFKLRLWTSILY